MLHFGFGCDQICEHEFFLFHFFFRTHDVTMILYYTYFFLTNIHQRYMHFFMFVWLCSSANVFHTHVCTDKYLFRTFYNRELFFVSLYLVENIWWFCLVFSPGYNKICISHALNGRFINHSRSHGTSNQTIMKKNNRWWEWKHNTKCIIYKKV